MWLELVRCSDTDDDSDDDVETRPAKEDEDEEARSWDMHHRDDDKISETQRRSRSHSVFSSDRSVTPSCGDFRLLPQR